MAKTLYKIIIYVPQTHLEQVRIAACNAGAGRIGKYDNCAFMISGIASYRPLDGAKPFQGEIGQLERTGEVRLEVTAEKSVLEKVIKAVKMLHPYEEPVIDVYKLEAF